MRAIAARKSLLLATARPSKRFSSLSLNTLHHSPLGALSRGLADFHFHLAGVMSETSGLTWSGPTVQEPRSRANNGRYWVFIELRMGWRQWRRHVFQPFGCAT